MSSDHSLGLYLLNTRLAEIKGKVERLGAEIHQAEIALINLRSARDDAATDLRELEETVTLLKGAMTAVVREHPPREIAGQLALDCE